MTGGAGYIGSTTALLLADFGYDVIVADNLSRGHREAVQPGKLREIDILDTAGLVRLLTAEPCDAVIHFAAFIAVGESMKIPEVYFRNNLAGSLSLLTAMKETGVKNIVFSSTAAVYGIPESSPIAETTPLGPVNAYGESKLMVEKSACAGSTKSTVSAASPFAISTRRAATCNAAPARATTRRPI